MSAVPGTRLLAFASRWFEPGVVARVFEPLVADLQREWLDTAPLRRAWVVVRGAAAFACAVVVSMPRIVATPVPSAIMRRVVMRIALFVSIGTALLSIPIFRTMLAENVTLTALLLVTSLPGIAAIVLPFSMVAAVDAIRCHEALPPHVERAAAVKVGAATVLLLLLFTGWLGPAMYREWRVTTGANATVPGLREMSMATLVGEALRHDEARVFTYGGTVRRELNNRATLIAFPVLLLWLRWRILDLPRRRWFSPLPAAVAVGLGIMVLFLTRLAHFSVEARFGLEPGTAMWMPFLLLPMWDMASMWLSRRVAA